MIISVEELKEYINTDVSDKVLEGMLQALETSIRGYTNNNFQKSGFRFLCDVVSGKLTPIASIVSEGDTIQISNSKYNDGVYVIETLENHEVTVKGALRDEESVIVTKIEYPADVKMGVVEIMDWKLKNKACNSGDTSKQGIQSETISRHSVTYVTDSTESDMNEKIGVPKKYTAFLRNYRKARF